MNLIYQDAITLTDLIAKGKLSSRALLEKYIERIQSVNPLIHCTVTNDFDMARRLADQADEAVKTKQPLGKLHGLPITIKDAYKVQGYIAADGNPLLKSYSPPTNAIAVEKLIAQGAIPVAKTNVPYKCADIQTYNAIYKTSNNPWNFKLTPGGSSGGAAGALAAGFTALELGSDIGGSIRIPAHFCGVYGHKTTYGIVSLEGHLMGDDPDDLAEVDMGVGGPMARTAKDLELLLDILVAGKPDAPISIQLPACTKTSLKDFKVLFWMDDESCPIDSRMKKVYMELLDTLKAHNVQVDLGCPHDWDFDEIFNLYALKLSSQMTVDDAWLSRVMLSSATPLFKTMSPFINLPQKIASFAAGTNLSHARWLKVNEQVLRLKQQCTKIFEQYDVIICPPTFTLAFPHNHVNPIFMRQVLVDGKKRFYMDLFKWISPATLIGLPATSAPVGLSDDHLPVNIQIISSAYSDKVTIKFAELLEKNGIGGFVIPQLGD